MHVPLQTTIEGREAPVQPPQSACAVCRPERTCTYCTTIAFGAKLARDQASLVRASLLARPDAPEPRR